ncbi:MAG: hypothetical protein V4501_03160 [Pseudomonadota bacterium]
MDSRLRGNDSNGDITLFEKLKNFYNESPENRIQIHRILGFGVLPVFFLAVLYIVMINVLH